MSKFKIFLSSTCYDLNTERDILKEWIETLGHESTLSDFGDICYNPREHTHISCVNAVKGHDALVVIIGSRFGGIAIPSVYDELDIDSLINESGHEDFLKEYSELSITQAEVLMAIECKIPIYVLIDSKVYQDHHTYIKSKKEHGIEFAKQIPYTSISTNGTAEYIFEFISYLHKRKINNGVETYDNINDIKTYLSKQWSQYFHTLLAEQKDKIFLPENDVDVCVNDKLRNTILDTFKPDLYIPLKENFCDLSNYKKCNTNVYPNMMVLGEYVEKVNWSDDGYEFNGKNLISVHMKDDLPCELEERSFIFAVKPTQLPLDNKPVFFFSYGQRRTHKCGDGINNHDKSFGLFFGEPAPEDDDEEIPEKYKGRGIRVFFYCEKCKKDRNSENCDTEVICEMSDLNKGHL